jgi:hypothetical protein
MPFSLKIKVATRQLDVAAVVNEDKKEPAERPEERRVGPTPGSVTS